eukprot:52010_1
MKKLKKLMIPKQFVDEEKHLSEDKFVNNNVVGNKDNEPSKDDETLPLYGATDVDKWLVHGEQPAYNDIEHEMLCNSVKQLDIENFVVHRLDCKTKYQHTTFNSERLSIHDLLSLKSFTDLDSLQKTFSEMYWNNKMIGKRKEFYYWG